MELHEKFIREGNWLFRWRSYLPLLMLAVFISAMSDFEYLGHSERLDALWEILCLLLSGVGLGIRVLTIGFVPKGTSGRNTKRQKAETLNTTGMYAIVRNPLYLGNFFMWLGISLFPHVWWLMVIYVLAFYLYYERIIFAEESFLKTKFGDRFADWAGKTPAFIPRFKKWQRPSLSFSLRQVLRREYNGFLALILAFFALEVAGDLNVKGRLEIDLMWLLLTAFGIAVWGVLLTLKKKTRLLDVERKTEKNGVTR
jgi:protein-S-isoprenylcysteine O-methyltransferase Ste14